MHTRNIYICNAYKSNLCYPIVRNTSIITVHVLRCWDQTESNTRRVTLFFYSVNSTRRRQQPGLPNEILAWQKNNARQDRSTASSLYMVRVGLGARIQNTARVHTQQKKNLHVKISRGKRRGSGTGKKGIAKEQMKWPQRGSCSPRPWRQGRRNDDESVSKRLAASCRRLRDCGNSFRQMGRLEAAQPPPAVPTPTFVYSTQTWTAWLSYIFYGCKPTLALMLVKVGGRLTNKAKTGSEAAVSQNTKNQHTTSMTVVTSLLQICTNCNQIF